MEVTYTCWIKDVDTIPANALAYIYEAHYLDSLLFENGGAFWNSYPVLSDIDYMSMPRKKKLIKWKNLMEMKLLENVR